MTTPPSSPPKLQDSDDPRIDLAIQRTDWALERTQLSWVRTSFAVISAGLALDKGTEALHEARLLKGSNWVAGGHVGGVLLSALAALLLVIATVHYHQRQRQLALACKNPPSPIQPVAIISWLVVLLGTAVSLLLLLWG